MIFNIKNILKGELRESFINLDAFFLTRFDKMMNTMNLAEFKIVEVRKMDLLRELFQLEAKRIETEKKELEKKEIRD